MADLRKIKLTEDPVISAEADARLMRIVKRFFLLTIFLSMVIMFSLVPINESRSPFFRFHRLIDVASVLIFMSPFYFSMAAISKERMAIGREYFDKHDWHRAVSAFEYFDTVGQRSQDRTGEAHYLLGLALAKTGKDVAAQRAWDFVRKHRSNSDWAKKVGEPIASEVNKLSPAHSAPRAVGGKRRRF
jgi:hypothetical protein